MCGRFNLTDSPALQSLMRELGVELPSFSPRYNIAPTEAVFTLYRNQGAINVREMRWWLTPRWVKQPSQQYAMFNARVETVATSRAFAQPFKTQRAIVPASSFIEWRRSGNVQNSERGESKEKEKEKKKEPKQALCIEPSDDVLLFAAIWEHWQGGEEEIYSCAILTADAVPEFAAIHHRQPLMLTPSTAVQWLDPDTSSNDLQHLMVPQLPVPLSVTPIDAQTNHARNKLAPVATGEPLWIG